MKKLRNTLITCLLSLIGLLLCLECGVSTCSSDQVKNGTCENSFVDKASQGGVPTSKDAVESEPNDVYYQSNSLLQTLNTNKSFDINNKSYARIGTINNSLDVDWYKIELAGSDFDKVNPQRSVSCDTNNNTNFRNCYDFANKKPDSNNIADSKDFVPAGATRAGEKFFKPRFVVRAESLDGTEIGLQIEVFPPGISIDNNGAITKKSIANSYDHILNTINALTTPNGTLRKVDATSSLQLLFPVRWEHSVRSGEFNSSEGDFYHTCWTESASTNPSPRYSPQLLAYQDLMKKDLNGFRTLDPYTSGTYYIRVTSNAAYKNKKYRLMWYWNTTETIVGYGGVDQYTLAAEKVGADIFNVEYSYDYLKQQLEGVSDSNAIPTGFCGLPIDAANNRIVSTSNSPFTGTAPYCRNADPTFAEITCSDPNSPATTQVTTDVFCFNSTNLSGKRTAGALGSGCLLVGSGLNLCQENQFNICEGDMNHDGKITSTAADIGCLFDRGACYGINYTYLESNRAANCAAACQY